MTPPCLALPQRIRNCPSSRPPPLPIGPTPSSPTSRVTHQCSFRNHITHLQTRTPMILSTCADSTDAIPNPGHPGCPTPPTRKMCTHTGHTPNHATDLQATHPHTHLPNTAPGTGTLPGTPANSAAPLQENPEKNRSPPDRITGINGHRDASSPCGGPTGKHPRTTSTPFFRNQRHTPGLFEEGPHTQTMNYVQPTPPRPPHPPPPPHPPKPPLPPPPHPPPPPTPPPTRACAPTSVTVLPGSKTRLASHITHQCPMRLAERARPLFRK